MVDHEQQQNDQMRRVGTSFEGYIYYGDRPDWLAVIGHHRESDALDNSNFRVIYHDLSERYGDAIVIERFNHFLVGWTESVLVNPANQDAVEAAYAWRARLADYPIANEDDFSELEMEETQAVMESAIADCERMGHTFSEEDAGWISSNGYTYERSCEACGFTIQVNADTQTYEWDAIVACPANEPDWNPRRFYTEPR